MNQPAAPLHTLTDKLVARKDGTIGWIIFNNPARHNATSYEMWLSIPPVLAAYCADPEVRVIIMRGEGEKAFSAGADISQFKEKRTGPEAVKEYNTAADNATQAMRDCAKPLIAMIRGYCIGGGAGIAVSSDIRIAADDARFAVPAAKLGLGYRFDGIKRLADIVGASFAAEIFFTARQFSAQEALAMGLVNRVVPAVELESYTLRYAETIAENAPLTIASVKRALIEYGKDPGAARSRARASRWSRPATRARTTRKARPAFTEKRKPQFQAADAPTGAPALWPAPALAPGRTGFPQKPAPRRRPDMAIDARRPDLTVGVIGTGAMGRGIAQVAAAGGMRVLMADSRPGAAQEAREFIGKMLDRAAEKGGMRKDEAVAAVERIAIVGGPAEIKPCHVVVEAIVENLEAKRELFAELEAVVAPDCILASNTSSLSVTTIAAKLKTPQRFAGFHFFNPVPLMKLVEVIEGLLTEPWVADALMEVGRRMTREPVRLKDAPGFLVNQVGRGFSLEASHLVYEGVSHVRGRRPRHARRRWFPHGAVRADGADGTRRHAARLGVDLPPVLPGAALPSESHHAEPLRGRRARPQDEAGLLRLRRRDEAHRAARGARRRQRARRASG